MIDIDIESSLAAPMARIKVLGVGGAGGNAINSMLDAEYEGVDFIAFHYDFRSVRRETVYSRRVGRNREFRERSRL